jgi:hypothetical protein
MKDAPLNLNFSADLLRALEQMFGSCMDVAANYGDCIDEIVPEDSARMRPACTGGDRMTISGYAPVYEEYLCDFVDKEFLLCEVGILKGSGLATWSLAFPKAQIIGLDIDIENFTRNFDALKNKGAFEDVPSKNDINNSTIDYIGDSKLNIFNFDQWDLETNKKILKRVLKKEKKIDVFIDDGDHQAVPNLRTLEAVEPYLTADSVYFIEDVDKENKKALIEGLVKKNLNYDIFGAMFVITKK